MATIKFSDFTNQTVDVTDTQVVGYKVGDATANYRYSMAQLATGLISGSFSAVKPTLLLTDTTNPITGAGETLASVDFYSSDTSGSAPHVGARVRALSFDSVGNKWDLMFATNNGSATPNERLRIDYTGKVGIGITAPTEILDVAALKPTIRLTDTTGEFSGAGEELGSVDFYTTDASGSAPAVGARMRAVSYDSVGNKFDLTFATNNGSAAPDERLRIDKDGKVGIGVTDPDSFLEVFGTTTQQKWSYDADSFATLTVADSSNTTLAVGETGTFTLDVPGNVTIDSDTGVITFSDGGASLATIATLRTESFVMACSDETTAITADTDLATFRMPYAFTLTAVRASLTTAGTTSGVTTIDVHESGTTILSTKITIDYDEKTSVTAAAQPVISDASLADDAEITIDVDGISGGGTEAGLKVTLIGYQTV